jgi:GTP-sensing pleiotropic transcriptional regulator CodY
MWGLGWNDTMGKNFFALHLTSGIIPEDLKQMINQVQDRMAPIKDKEMNYKTPSGDEHTVVVSIIPLTKGVNYLGTLVLCRDVTADIERYKS